MRKFQRKGISRVLLAAAVLCNSCGDIQAQVQAGVDFGNEHNLQECVAESLSQLEGCESFKCEALLLGFSRGCSEAAGVDARFCAGVPKSLLESVGWIASECAASRSPKACAKILKEPVKMCLEEGAA